MAKQIWETKIAGIFKIAGIGCKVIVTESANHAFNVIQSAPLHNYDGVISVGGDGMFSQVTWTPLSIALRHQMSSVDFS